MHSNTAVETIKWDLSKPPQRRQYPYPRPFRLLVGTPSFLRPELAFRWAQHSFLWQKYLYIFDILFSSPYMFVKWLYAPSALVDCWSSVCFSRILFYKFLNLCPFNYATLSLIHLTILSWSAIIVLSKLFVAFYVLCVGLLS